MVILRIKTLLKAKQLKVDDLAMKTNIAYSRWANVLSGKAKLRHVEVEALGNAYPEYKLWLAYGDTLPQVGQISPNSTPP
jgi:transcriptional regulator with XRE-family HTH domain